MVCFDPWQRSHNFPHYDVTAPQDLNQLLDQIDQVVLFAGKSGMYVVINYHDTGRYEPEFAEAFWRAVAPRYAHLPHVIYELLNEPVEWFPEHYSPEVIDYQNRLYSIVRELAPDTHLIMLTFANTVGFVSGCTMESVAAKLDHVDWANASVGFHTYHTGGTSAPIQALRRSFPVINTEACVPKSHGGLDAVEPMDADEWPTQTMERLGISWFAWLVDGNANFTANFEQGILYDAQAKGYEWTVEFPRSGSFLPGGKQRPQAFPCAYALG